MSKTRGTVKSKPTYSQLLENPAMHRKIKTLGDAATTLVKKIDVILKSFADADIGVLDLDTKKKMDTIHGFQATKLALEGMSRDVNSIVAIELLVQGADKLTGGNQVVVPVTRKAEDPGTESETEEDEADEPEKGDQGGKVVRYDEPEKYKDHPDELRKILEEIVLAGFDEKFQEYKINEFYDNACGQAAQAPVPAPVPTKFTWPGEGGVDPAPVAKKVKYEHGSVIPAAHNIVQGNGKGKALARPPVEVKPEPRFRVHVDGGGGGAGPVPASARVKHEAVIELDSD